MIKVIPNIKMKKKLAYCFPDLKGNRKRQRKFKTNVAEQDRGHTSGQTRTNTIRHTI